MGDTTSVPARMASAARRVVPAAERWRTMGGRSIERSVVWMLGSPRTGSTWLLSLMRISPRVVAVDEPFIGTHLGLFSADVMGAHPAGFDETEPLLMTARSSDPQYFLSEVRSSFWRPHLRRLVLSRMYAYIAESGVGASNRPVVVVKEPTGSQAAGPLLDLLPESKLLFLMRDGRDVLDSEIDAVQRGGWLARQFGSEDMMGEEILLEFARAQAYRWVSRTRYVAAAYERHPSALRKLVRYEDLRARTEPVLTEILDWLGLDYDASALSEHVRRLGFEQVPVDQRGPGKFNRSARPGGWRDNLARPVLDVIHPIMAGELDRYGYGA